MLTEPFLWYMYPYFCLPSQPAIEPSHANNCPPFAKHARTHTPPPFSSLRSQTLFKAAITLPSITGPRSIKRKTSGTESDVKTRGWVLVIVLEPRCSRLLPRVVIHSQTRLFQTRKENRPPACSFSHGIRHLPLKKQRAIYGQFRYFILPPLAKDMEIPL